MRIRISLAALALVGLVAPGGPAHADEVRTLAGPGGAGADMFVTYVGCDSFFGPAAAPQSRLNLGPGAAPSGRRTLGLIPGGPRTAAGPYARFSSLSGLDASVAASSGSGTTGASYIWALTPDVLPGTAWSGRADTVVPAGGWHDVDAGSLTYSWSLVDLATRKPVADAGEATPAEFAARHGDGEGYVVTGFGCDGNAVNIDAVRAGGTTWDFEGIALTTRITAGATEVVAGATVTLTGQVTDAAGRLTGDALVLETRTPGGQWRPVGGTAPVDRDGTTRVDVAVRETAEFRWHRPESQYADEGWSDVVTVRADARPAEGTETERGGDQQGTGRQ